MKKKFFKKSNFLNIFVTILAALYAVPMYTAVVNAFKSYKDMTLSPFTPPTKIYLDNFIEVMNKINLFVIYRNSLLITSVSVVLVVILSAMAAYPLARYTTRLNKFVSKFFIVGLMIPSGLSIISLIKLLMILKISGTYLGLFLTYAGSAWICLVIFMYVGFIKTVPKQLDESAYIDGAGYFRTFWQIIFPVLKPCTGSAIIIASMGIWNDFLTPFILLGGGDNAKTITLAIYNFAGKYTSRFNLIFTVMLLSATPIIILFILMQKQFIKGLTSGSVKG